MMVNWVVICTKLRNLDGHWCVPSVDWNSSGWNRNANWLDNDWDSNYRVVLLVILFISSPDNFGEVLFKFIFLFYWTCCFLGIDFSSHKAFGQFLLVLWIVKETFCCLSLLTQISKKA